MAEPIKGKLDKDGKQKWIAPVRNPNTLQRTTETVFGYEQAKTKIRDSETMYFEARKGSTGELLSTTCKRYLEMVEKKYGDDKTLPGHKRTRWRGTEININLHILRFFDNVATRSIALADLHAFHIYLIDDAAAGLSLASARRVISTLRKVLQHAKAHEVIQVDPMEKFDRVETGKFLSEHRPDPPEALSLGEVRGLLDSTTGLEKLFMHLMLLTGMRSAEALGLRWRHVDENFQGIWIFETGEGYSIEGELKIMRSRTKTHAGARFVPAAPKLSSVLKAAREALTDFNPEAHVFLSRQGEPYSYRGLAYRLQSIQNNVVGRQRSEYANALNATNHELRHTCVAIWIATGISFSRIAKWIGHSNPATTIRHYGHLLQDPDLPDY